MKKRPSTAKLFVVSAPSGGGKTTLCKRLLEDGLGLADSVSMTTRSPRAGETDGVDYHFVSERRFRDTARKKGFLEYEANFGNMYGTPKKFVEENLKKGTSVLLSIDVKGAMKVKKAYPGSILIFLLPPSMKVLKKRLHSRMSDTSESISRRLALAKKELLYKNRYDHRVINDRLDTSYKRLKSVIVKELREE